MTFLSNFPNLTSDERIILAGMMTPMRDGTWGIPSILRGDPGTAKTALLQTFGAALGMPVLVFTDSIREPADIIGLPMLQKYADGDRKGQTFSDNADPRWVHLVNDSPRAMLFLDEFSGNAQAMQNAFLRVVNERWVGQTQLAEGVRILAAMNEVDDAAGGHDLAMPAANRFYHSWWNGPSLNAWCDYMNSVPSARPTPTDADAEELRVMLAWPAAFAWGNALVTAFMRSNANLLHQKPEPHTPEAGKPWPSRRTWDFVAHALAASRVHDLTPAERDTFIAGLVGTEAAAEFASWLRSRDLPDTEQLLDGNIVWTPNPDRLDIIYAVISSATAFVIHESMDDDVRRRRCIALWKLLDATTAFNSDCAVSSARQLEDASMVPGDAAVDRALVKLFGAMKAADMVRC